MYQGGMKVLLDGKELQEGKDYWLNDDLYGITFSQNLLQDLRQLRRQDPTKGKFTVDCPYRGE
jgi:hypothetical protein